MFITVSGVLLHYRAVITLSGVFLLHYWALITVSGVYYIIGWYKGRSSGIRRPYSKCLFGSEILKIEDSLFWSQMVLGSGELQRKFAKSIPVDADRFL